MNPPDHMLPLNPALMDTLVKGDETGWIPNDAEGKAFMKVLFVSEETGQWGVLFRWKQGYVAGPHKHLSPAHTFILSGKLEIRDGVLEAGDYIYERNGMIHEKTEALEDTARGSAGSARLLEGGEGRGGAEVDGRGGGRRHRRHKDAVRR